MADKPDLTNLKNKLNVNSIMDSLKSMINPSAGVPEVDPDDDLGLKVVEISTLLKEMTNAQEEQAKNLKKVNELLNVAFKDIEQLRADIKPIREEKKAQATTAEAPENKK